MSAITKLLMGLVVTAGVVGIVSYADHGNSPIGTAEAYHEPGAWSNLTVWAVGPNDRDPGKKDATYNWYMGIGLNHTGDTMILTSEGMQFQQCTTPDLRAEGIARKGQRRYVRPPMGDDTTTETNESIVTYREESKLTKDGIWVDWYDEEDLGGEAPKFKASDEIVVSFDSCLINADDPGWYQMNIYFNGTSPDGEYVETQHDSHYYAVCDCESRQEAVEVLGPPPSQQDETPTEDPGTATSTLTEEPGTATSTPTPTEEPGTATPTPTPTKDQETATPTSLEEPETATPTSNQAGKETDTTDAGGPGFGATVAIVSLLFITYSVVRKNE